MTTPFRFALASASFRVGGLADNARKMAQWAEQARDQFLTDRRITQVDLAGAPPQPTSTSGASSIHGAAAATRSERIPVGRKAERIMRRP